MTCAACGTPLVPGARFCFHCGAPQDVPASLAGAERRIVTVLFGDLTDFTAWAEDLDPERVGVVTDRLLAALADAVTEVGGHVDKLTGDGIMALFGAPTAHEDDPERAVLAAAGMQSSLARLVAEETGGGGRRLGLRVGINTGEVLAGVQGRVSYTVVGDAVNTASRLSDAAGVGAVFAGRSTAAATLRIASWRTLQPLRLKGKREPVEAYELIGLRGGSGARLGLGDEAPTIGREAELGALVGQLLSVTDRGTPAGVLVVGDAGVGKTRLVVELARFVGELPGSRVLTGQCTPFGLSRDLAPLAQLVRTACGIDDDDSAAVAADRVERTVARLDPPPRAAWTPATLRAQLLGLLGLAPGGVGPARGGDLTPGLRVERPDVDGMVALITALAEDDPVVLIVDDLHLARPPLRAALGEVMRRVRGQVLFVGCGRQVPGGPADPWADIPYDEVVPVGPLERSATERLLRASLGGEQLGAGARDAILDRAEGNPFFLAELLHLLVDTGLLLSHDGQWTLRAEIPDDLLPAGVQAVLTARIDSLEPAARTLLRDAAVLGTSFSLDALAHLDARLDAAAVPAALQALVERGMLTAVGRGRYAFAHTLARDVAYAGLPKGERARRHAAAAQWAATHMDGVGGEADAVTAVQADRALRLAREMRLPVGDPAWAVGAPGLAAATRLGRAALARDDHLSAETHLTRALRLATGPGDAEPEPELVAPVQAAYAEALAGQRRLSEAGQILAGPLAAAAPGVRAAALLVLGDVRRKQADDAGARAAFTEAQALADSDLVAGGALRQLGLLDLLEGRLADAEDRFGAALELAERVGDERGAGWALQHLAWSATTRADYDVVEHALGRASEVFGRLQDTGGLAWCAGTEALVRLLQGRLTEAREMVGGLLPVAEQMGARWEIAAGRVIAAIAAAELGELPWAQQQTALAAQGFEGLGDSWGRAMTAVAEGIVARAQGRTRDARTALRRAADLGAGGGHHTLELLASVVLGLVHLDRGDNRAAAQAANRAESLAATLDLSDTAGAALKVLRAQVLRARGRLPEARALLEAAASADQPTFLFPRRQAVAHLAGLALQEGDLTRARQTIARALEIPAEDVRSQVVTQRVLAQVLAADGDPAGASQAAADALQRVESAGLTSELAATRRVAARVGLPKAPAPA